MKIHDYEVSRTEWGKDWLMGIMRVCEWTFDWYLKHPTQSSTIPQCMPSCPAVTTPEIQEDRISAKAQVGAIQVSLICVINLLPLMKAVACAVCDEAGPRRPHDGTIDEGALEYEESSDPTRVHRYRAQMLVSQLFRPFPQ